MNIKHFTYLFFFFSLSVLAQKNHPLKTEDFRVQKAWVDSTYNAMNLDQKIGQLFMVDIFSSKSKAETDKIKDLIKENYIGGIIFSKGGPMRQAKLNNEYQELANVPLLIGMDAEWGLAMRLDSTYAFPWNMTLGAIEDNKLIKKTGAQIAKHCKRLGVHINFAPVVDINNNPDNPIIGNRSFGENKGNVTEKAVAFMQGMQSEGVLSSAKHFPGHGDTDVDSHKSLPTLDFTKKRLDSLELYPFKRMIKEGVSSIMIGHLNVPALEPRINFPSSLSKPIVTDLLQKKLNYEGLVFTDALNMRGVADYDEPGEIDLAAFLAGNDILLISENVPKAAEKIKEAYLADVISEKRLEKSVKKILSAKYKVGLNHYQPVDTNYLIEDLNSIHNDLLYEELMENAITVIKNNKGILPIKNLEDEKIAYVNLGEHLTETSFLQQLKKYTEIDHVQADNLGDLLEKLKDYDLVILGYHKSNSSPWASYHFSEKELVWLHEIARTHQTILSVFARPYAILDIKSTTNIDGIVLGYQNSEIAQQKTAQVIFGAIPAKGKLPVSLGQNFPVGTKFTTQELQRLSYGLPESVGINSAKLYKIDSIAQLAVKEEMTPGIQMLVARKGKVIYQKNFGYHTYENELPVTDTTIYDLASLTKIMATLPLVMELEEQGKISLDTKLKQLIPLAQDSNKADITLKEMLSHYARLQAWIPFYTATLSKDGTHASPKYFRSEKTDIFNVPVSEKFYMRKDIQDSMYQKIIDSDLLTRKEYKYSDLPYYLLKKSLEHYYAASLHTLTQNHLYESLGANYMGYLPLRKFNINEIAPSEVDDYWRFNTIQGTVHDQGAAMFGGIGGHAGIFSNANDVAKMMQMYLNKGSYGGIQYFKPETIDKFNTCYYCEDKVRRGVGFDKPQLEKVGPTCGCVSMTSFGHSGFTGTFAWADPEEEIVYIFLSNRTFPFASNRKLISHDIRTKIQKLIYESIMY
ncbi:MULTISPECIES: glycoside hydrolase family 3 N-terminal domain-containing protein [Mesonia]|uniref:Beta-hexosaminidase n=1 Tax=Mesonia oceanica TaxID=2687242 RepID=A0AC61Y4N3_9FLAO|nr:MULTISPECIES: glycoside hydrolase family 3 N-terminal domain-containing protein [Mesonia]MAN26561.1 beta-N-acetylglucosaminidase [Mesonia sp.]MAQ40829.1 beta-N-acetylglucosaminidase [Mesonia sp.]MBJ97750.1 beta-N-acetylglucosaminidase [Flavobacteriaceae bacterium]VVU99456.1 Beta-hexosaminidase [Mesonia oceanica]|tara:strand:- start:37135 stop:40053 length:2919 start_codon:yes stop_codon:yes gene_type:complete